MGGNMGRFRLSALLGGVLTALLLVTAGPVAPSTAAVSVDDAAAASWQVDGTVYAVLVVGDRVFVGGTFANAVGPAGQTVARKNLAAFSLSTGALDTGWRADAGAVVRALASDGTSLYVGGGFAKLGNQARSRLGKVSVATGAVDASFKPTVDNTVRALALNGSRIFVGGNFSSVNGTARTRLAAVSTTSGALDTAFKASASAFVYGLRVTPAGDRLYVTGDFTTLSGSSRPGIGSVSPTSGSITGPALAGSVRPTFGVDVNEDGSRVFAATGAGSNAPVAWNSSTGARVWRVTTDGDVQAIRYYAGTVYFGFHDGYHGNTSLHALAANATNGSLDAGFRPTMVGFWGTWAIDATASGVVLGGAFTQVSGTAHRGWARFVP